MSTLADRVQQIYRGELSPPPVARLIGFALAAIQPGQEPAVDHAGQADADASAIGVRTDAE